MNANQKKQDQLFKEEIKNFSDEDYQNSTIVFEARALSNCAWQTSGQGSHLNNDLPKAYKTSFNEYIYFQTKKLGVIVDIRAKQLEGGTFQMQELTMNAYNAMEQRVSQALNA